jgi:nicotinamide-nucleotide amidase
VNAEALLAAARARNWRIATAESCTGGLLSAALTDIFGSSEVFECGYVTYSNASKSAMLGVETGLIAAHGAVSEPVALAMARGALFASTTDLAIAITGVAGPGASENKPAGLVWIAIATRVATRAWRHDFCPAGRGEVRRLSVKAALGLASQAIGVEP